MDTPKKCAALIFFLFLISAHSRKIKTPDVDQEIIYDLFSSLQDTLKFLEVHYKEINIDGLLGITLAQAQIEDVLEDLNPDFFREHLLGLLKLCQELHRRILPRIESISKKEVIFKNILLNPTFWKKQIKFKFGLLQNLGTYQNWTSRDILENKHASYKGTPTDDCLQEVLEDEISNSNLPYAYSKFPNLKFPYGKKCYVSPICQEMMFARRIDNGYLLTHRLLYLQIAHQGHCFLKNHEMYNYHKYLNGHEMENSRKYTMIKFQENYMKQFSNWYCSLILKEARTNEALGFPQHDIFLEQLVLCSMEGYSEFLVPKWRNLIIKWKTHHGCYKANGTDDNTVHDYNNRHGTGNKYDPNKIQRQQRIKVRSTNVISFGCTDHTTGLGTAALSLHLRYVLYLL